MLSVFSLGKINGHVPPHFVVCGADQLNDPAECQLEILDHVVGAQRNIPALLFKHCMSPLPVSHPPQASFVHGCMSAQGVPPQHIRLDRQLTFYNDLFGWSRITFAALAGRSPPDILYGPTREGIITFSQAGFLRTTAHDVRRTACTCRRYLI